MIFVFGSNLQGRHGKGAALVALEKFGAVYGQGEGLQGDSYAIPTKITPYKIRPLVDIKKSVDKFISFADNNKELQFYVTAIGCGLAGYTVRDIAPLFKTRPSNVTLCDQFREFLNYE